ncbi:uncharacterized protein L3040_000704 [Drepanopeziza brunnea f. sp. 'multigermtubi']|uniref:Uncharacterized protein n=1 Tax=Marssonina brunnea f. sp. multigermtubi (strain MB_m1) TaxID=1072389 RepID=K1X886_MARBU|nr:uncharacterized protein MBM_00369 [Drepanopeziza brunnea f. sp. 'multigermtubi' MB_m1]EKD21256.1 hypothetical protein MBM_00369 [Drepanopeziza brunnea f. sp. 'multigermtubi' MB_m1]KAJ5054430.1 hypothetical protein L3040_000704 [Drepanopeziza brunnea f. sp. 'multigermtubi']
MYQIFIIAGFVAVAAASPAAQAIDFSLVNSALSPTFTSSPWGANKQSYPHNTASSSSVEVPTTTPQPTATTYRRSSGTSTTSSDTSCPTQPEAGTYCGFINPNDACAPQPDGYGPHVEPDTVAAFRAYPEFSQQALAAAAPGYTSTFKNLNASFSAKTYLGLTTFTSYDAPLCAEYCNKKDLCTGFNIYVERDPSQKPAENCTQPASITNYKCTLWGSGVSAESATNYGGYRRNFQIAIAGSDGFEKTNTTIPATPPGWHQPKKCGGDGSKVHNHPGACIGTHFFPGAYNPALCAAYADAQNARHAKSSFGQKLASFWTSGKYNPQKCKFFNSYMLKKNGRPLGTYCGLYSKQYDGSAADYSPGWQGSTFWGIESSWSFSIKP